MNLSEAFATFERVWLLVFLFRQHLDVATRAKVATRARKADGTHRGIVTHFDHRGGKGLTHRVVQRIALLWPVHGQDGGRARSLDVDCGHGVCSLYCLQARLSCSDDSTSLQLGNTL